MILEVFMSLHLLIGLVASMNITRILQTVGILEHKGKWSLLQMQTTMFFMNLMIGLHVVTGLTICFCCLLNNIRRNGHGNILSEEDECSSSKEDERMSELNECRTIISELYEDIGTINTKILTLQYRIDNIFGEDCSINKSIVHRVLSYFGLA